MLVDAAKHGDVEIPVFCYEPKLGAPVGACRMCLVEIEGIPKLQTGCSTPVKDGMVVHTQTQRVHEAQRAVVEFLLINHPLDCPVCDKGGECPLQDITYGWGAGTSRFIEPKRHFRKPLELSPLIAIDRERCILCYRCVRFSQEISEDYQLILSERGAHSFVSTFDGHPYVAPFSGNIIELCPVGALTSTAYRFRARPWDIEGAGTICTYCPSQCNVELTVRDDRVMRVLAREHDEVDDGWLCDKGRFAYQSTHVDERITQPLVREGSRLTPARVGQGARRRRRRRSSAPARGPRRSPARTRRTRRRSCSRGCSATASAPARSPAARRARCPPRCRARSPTPRCRRPSRTSSSPTRCSCSTATRSTTRRSSTCASARACAATACDSAVATRPPRRARPERRDRAALRARRRRGAARRPRRRGSAATRARSAARPPPPARTPPPCASWREWLSGAGDRRRDRLRRAAAEPGRAAPRPRRRCSTSPPGSGWRGRDGAGLLEIPAATNGRGIREAGLRARARPGLRGRRARPRRGFDDAHRALPAARRPDPDGPRPRRLGGPAGRRPDGDRARLDAHGHRARARRRRLPRRGLRREGGHADASRRPRAAAARRDRPPGRRARRRRAAGLAGDRRRVRARAGLDQGVLAGPDGLAAAVRRGAVLRRALARPDRRPRRPLARERSGRRARRDAVGARRAERPAAGRRPPTTATCGSARGARCGPRPRSTSRPRCASCSRARSSSSRPSTPTGSACATATRSRSVPTARACAAPRGCAPRCPAARCSSSRARTRSRPTC